MDDAIDEDRLYRVVNEAVRDAIFYVLGTALLVGFGGAMILSGVMALPRGGLQSALGAGLVLVGAYLAGTALGVIPSVREWR